MKQINWYLEVTGKTGEKQSYALTETPSLITHTLSHIAQGAKVTVLCNSQSAAVNLLERIRTPKVTALVADHNKAHKANKFDIDNWFLSIDTMN